MKLKLWRVSRASYYSAIPKTVHSNTILADVSFLSPNRRFHIANIPVMTKSQLSSWLLQANLQIIKVSNLCWNIWNVLIWLVFSCPCLYPCFYPYHDHLSLCFHSFPGAGPFLFHYRNHDFYLFVCLDPFLNRVLYLCLCQIMLAVDYYLDYGFGAVSLKHHAYPSSLKFFLQLQNNKNQN